MFIDATADNCHIVSAGWTRIDADVLREFARYPSANVGDAMDRFGLMHSSVRARGSGNHVVGTALPILTREGDNLAVHRALDEAAQGDVLVVNGCGDRCRAVFGDLLAEVCVVRGVVAVVVDGAVRDVDAIAALGLPVWASAVTPAGPTKNGPGVIGAPVACGGVVVSPGDVVVADRDGVAVVPFERVTEVLRRLTEVELGEQGFRQRLRRQAANEQAMKET